MGLITRVPGHTRLPPLTEEARHNHGIYEHYTHWDAKG